MEPGEFVWHSLGASDLQASARFYEGLLGWRARRVAENALLLTRVARHGEEPVGSIVAVAGAGLVPDWRPHLAVPALEAHLALAAARGGRLVQGPEPGPLGRVALLADPTGALYGAVEPTGPTPVHEIAAGRFVWHQLLTADQEAAVGYYGALAGWRRRGPPGPHAFMGLGEVELGAISQEPQAHPGRSRWIAYLQVDDLAAALRTAEAQGATLVVTPREVPPLGKLAIVEDPDGAQVGIITRPVG
jgi:predicted enzyme related to lactoylglutathione lyase